jgi:hypothetical protein
MLERIRVIAACAIGASLAAACGAPPHGSPLPASPGESIIRAPAPHRHARMTVRLKIPRHSHRRSRYISPNTQSIAILQGTTTLGTFDTASSSNGCAASNGATICEFVVGVAPGSNQTFTIDAYDAAGGGGKLLSTGSATQDIAAGQNNQLLLTLSGVVASVTLALQNPNPPAGTAVSVPLTVMAKDADGNVIVGAGNYEPAIELTDSDASGIAALSGTAVANPAATITLAYNGKSITTATIGATVSGVPASKITSAVFAPAPTVVADFPLPLAAGSTPIDPTSITTGPDGNIWFGMHSHSTTTSGIGKMTTSGAMTIYVEGTAPSTNLPLEILNGVIGGPDGNVWYAGKNGDVGFITPSGSVTNYPLTGGSICSGANAWRLAHSADGGFWVTIGCTGGGTQILHVTTGGTITPYTIAGFDYVNGLMLGKDGNIYAAGEMHSNGDPAVAQAIVSGATIASSNLLDVAAAGSNFSLDGIFQTPDGDFWVTNNACSPSVLTRIHPSATFSASTMTAYPSLAGCAYLAYGVALADGTLWIADGNYPILTRVTPATYPAAPALWDLAAQSTVPGEEWDVTIGPDGDLYISDYDETATVSGDILKVAY